MEEQSLTELAKNWKGITPRMANIFFFRYLLFKNLLIQQYSQNGRPNRWLSGAGIGDSLRILKYYSSKYDPELVRQQGSNFSQSEDPLMEIKFDSPRDEISALKKDWRILFDVLELVIAY